MPAQTQLRREGSSNPCLIAMAVMLATFMEVLDTSIAAVALPYIAGNLSATSDEATWVLTSYLVSNALWRRDLCACDFATAVLSGIDGVYGFSGRVGCEAAWVGAIIAMPIIGYLRLSDRQDR
jgi:MFS family permease